MKLRVSKSRLPSISEMDRKLERYKSIATIVSAVAIPVILAICGYFTQKSLANEGIKKDYVQMAINLLKEDPAKQHPSLREWAIEVLDKNSPVPISKILKDGLQKKRLLTTSDWNVVVDALELCTVNVPTDDPPLTRIKNQQDCIRKAANELLLLKREFSKE